MYRRGLLRCSFWLVGNARASSSGRQQVQDTRAFLYTQCYSIFKKSVLRVSCRHAQSAMTELHIGKMIREEVEKQERSVTWFAAKLSCSRVNVYNIFARANIDVILLMRISKILHRNFLQEVAEQFKI